MIRKLTLCFVLLGSRIMGSGLAIQHFKPSKQPADR